MIRIPLLHLDPDLVAVNKPAGIPTHAVDPADPYPGDVLRIIQAQTGLAYLGMHQRLDAETSGVLIFAARREANRPLAAAFAGGFAGGAVRKVYLALAHGTPPRAEGVIDAPIVRDHGERYRVTTASDPRGQAARTRYRVIGRGRADLLAGRELPIGLTAPTLLEIMPETGRPHQIRVHLAHIGCPVVGDPLYGPPDAAAFFPRLCLHAAQITLPHPATGQPVTFTAPPPALFTNPTPPPSSRRGGAGGEVGGGGLALAIERRAPLAADPATSIYRVVNAAADGFPGLTADRYGDALIVSLYNETALPAGLAEGLLAATGTAAVYIKRRPKQASRLSDAELAALAPRRPLIGPDLGEFVAHEEGLAYLIRPGDGLSVGLFPDMRETRARVRAWASGRRVLNCFAYTCGFGVAATAAARRACSTSTSPSRR